MFPKFIVITTLTTPATPSTPEKQELLESLPANNQQEAEQRVLSRSDYWRDNKVPKNMFGPGVPSVQSAIFVQQAPPTVA